MFQEGGCLVRAGGPRSAASKIVSSRSSLLKNGAAMIAEQVMLCCGEDAWSTNPHLSIRSSPSDHVHFTAQRLLSKSSRNCLTLSVGNVKTPLDLPILGVAGGPDQTVEKLVAGEPFYEYSREEPRVLLTGITGRACKLIEGGCE